MANFALFLLLAPSAFAAEPVVNGFTPLPAYDGPRDCPGMRNERPRSPIFPVADEVAWEERRRELAGGP